MAILPKDRLKGRCESAGPFFMHLPRFLRICDGCVRAISNSAQYGAVRRNHVPIDAVGVVVTHSITNADRIHSHRITAAPANQGS
jgi:hypothetical protein